MLPEPPARQSQSQTHSQRLLSLGVHIEMSILDPQLLLVNHIQLLIRLQRLVMNLPAEDDDSRASSHDSMPALPALMDGSSTLDEMFPVMEIEHGRYFV